MYPPVLQYVTEFLSSTLQPWQPPECMETVSSPSPSDYSTVGDSVPIDQLLGFLLRPSRNSKIPAVLVGLVVILPLV